MWQGQSYDDSSDTNKFVFDLGDFVGDLTVEEDASRYSPKLFMFVSLLGLQKCVFSMVGTPNM